MEDYRTFRLSKTERRNYYIAACCLLFGMGFLFYRNPVLGALCCLAAKPLEGRYAEYKGSERRKALAEGFKDVLYSISGSVASGRQMPAAIADAAEQCRISPGEEADITKELRQIVAVYDGAHGSVEELLSDFGERSGIDEIRHFAASYRICKANGGDMETVCLKSANLLIDRLEFRTETEALISQKKLDIAILSSLPILVLIFLNLVSYDYIRVLYTTFAGRLIMTACLTLFGLAVLWSLRITEIAL